MKRIVIRFSRLADSKEKIVSSLRNMIDCIESDEHEIGEMDGFDALCEPWSVTIDVADV